VGLDCAVIDLGSRLLALKTDPITFTTDSIGWYAVQINANDIATTGAVPRWFLMNLLLPQKDTTPTLVEAIFEQVYQACRFIGVSVIGGHTEITVGLDRPILVGTMIGEVLREDLVTPRGAQPGDRILITKGIPIEATAILAREFPDRLAGFLTREELDRAQGFLSDPGISVLREARLAVKVGEIHAMHDPTEGGVAAALWELAEASGNTLLVDPGAIPIPPLAARVCQALQLDPLEAIASGALLLCVPSGDAARVREEIQAAGIPCAEIGEVQSGPPAVWTGKVGRDQELRRPERDAIAKLFEE
jgi:hydrogenase maturation factor